MWNSLIFVGGLFLLSWGLRYGSGARSFCSWWAFGVEKHIKGYYPLVYSFLSDKENKPIRRVALFLLFSISVVVAVFVGLGCGWLGGVALFYFLFGMMVCTSYVLFVCVVVVTGYTAMALVSWVLANGCLVITIVVFVSYYRKEIGNSYYWSCFGTVEKASSSEGNCVDQEGSVSGEGGSVGVDVPFEESSGCQEAEKDLKSGLGKSGKSPEMGSEGESDSDSEEELCKMRSRV